jgi:hypothetical protein
MTVATYSTNLATILVEFASTTGWTAIGTGGAGLTAPETDYFIQGNNCITKSAWAGAVKGMIWNSTADQGGSGTDGAYVMWCTHTAPNSLDTKAGGGMRFLIGSGTGAYDEYYVGGSDTNTFLKWTWAAVNEASTPDSTVGSPTSGVEQYFGMTWDLPSGGPTKGAPAAIDGIRFGRCDIIIEHGTGADPDATFDGVMTGLETASNRYGMLVQREAGAAFENSGLMQFGSSTNAVNFTDSNKTIFIRDHDHVTANFHTWEVQNASSTVDFTNLIVAALGTTSRGRWVTTDNATLTWNGCSFTDMGTFGFDSNAALDACTFRRCDAITCTGAADLTNCIFDDTNVAANSSALIWNPNVDPNGNLDGSSFTKGTTDTHAIEFGTASPLTMTLTDIDWSGYVNTVDVNGSALHIKRTTGTVTINIIGGTGFPGVNSYRTDGATVNIVLSPVTTQVTAQEADGTLIENARVLLEASDGTGDLPFQDTVTITNTTTTAHVAHTAHGMSNGDISVIRNANEHQYNGPHTISNVTTNAYDYTMGSDPGGSATGTINATGGILEGLTDGFGVISVSRTWTLAQPATGTARKSTTAGSLFKPGSINGTISTSADTAFTAVLIPDE